jgi:hypothetical protein
MDQIEVNTDGSTAPETKAVLNDALWEQVVAANQTLKLKTQLTTQAVAIEEQTAPESTETALLQTPLTQGVAGQIDTGPVGSNGDSAGAEVTLPALDDTTQGSGVTGRAVPEEDGPDAVTSNAMVSNGTAAIMGTTTQVESGLTQFAKIYPLDQAKRLNPKSFPHPPKGESTQVITTFSNVQYLLDMNGIAPSYCVIKKKLYIAIPGHVGSADNYDNVALAHIMSLATLNGMANGAIPGLLAAVGDRYLRNPAKEWIESKPWDGLDRFEEFAKTLQERKGYPPSMKKLLLRKFLRSMVAAALMSRGFRCRGVLVLQGKQSIGKGAWIQAIVSDPLLWPPGRTCRDLAGLETPMGSGLQTHNLGSIRSECWSASDLDLTLRAIALAFDTHGLNVVQQPVKQRRCQDGVVVEDSGPLLVDPVGGDQGGTAFIAMAEDLKQTVCPELVNGQVAQLVNAQYLWLDVMMECTFDAASGLCFGHCVDDLDGPGEQHRVSLLTRSMAQRRHQMTLAQTGA